MKIKVHFYAGSLHYHAEDFPDPNINNDRYQSSFNHDSSSIRNKGARQLNSSGTYVYAVFALF